MAVFVITYRTSQQYKSTTSFYILDSDAPISAKDKENNELKNVFTPIII